MRRRKRGLANQVDYTCVCFLQFRILNNEFIRRRLDLFAIIRDQQWRLLLDSQGPITFDPNADGVREPCAPVFLRDQLALAVFCQKTAFDQHSRNFCETKHSKPRALDASIVLGEVTEQGMIDAR